MIRGLALAALLAVLAAPSAASATGSTGADQVITKVDRSTTVAGAVNLIGGSPANAINSSAYAAAILSGGTSITGGACTGSCKNEIVSANSNYSVIAGGVDNAIGTTTDSQASFIGGGGHNTANAQDGHSAIVGGSTNSCTGAAGNGYCSIGGGSTNSVAGNLSHIGGGFTNSIGSGSDFASIVGGNTNSIAASTDYSVILGGLNNTLTKVFAAGFGRSINARTYGGFTQGSRTFAATGDAQTTVATLLIQTTNNTATELFADGPIGLERVEVPVDTTIGYHIIVTARRTDADNESAVYECRGGIDNNAGTTALLTGTATDCAAVIEESNWTVTISASDAADSLVVKATGENAKTINWLARVELVEVTG